MLQQIQQWLNKLYYYIRILSIDIVLGAVSVSLFATQLFESQTPKVFWLLLPLVVWLIYTFDHITDGVNIKSQIQKPTYEFHLKNKSILILTAIIISVIITILYFTFFNKTLLKITIIGGGWIVVYFLVHKLFTIKIQNWFPKELFISVGYMIGTFGVPYLTKSRSINRIDLMILTCYFLLVLINVLIYSYFDFEEDKHFGFAGIIQATGLKTGNRIILILVIICDILSLYLLITASNIIVITLMSFGMSLIIFKPMLFKKNRLYGKIADALFLLPGLIIIVC